MYKCSCSIFRLNFPHCFDVATNFSPRKQESILPTRNQSKTLYSYKVSHLKTLTLILALESWLAKRKCSKSPKTPRLSNVSNLQNLVSDLFHQKLTRQFSLCGKLLRWLILVFSFASESWHSKSSNEAPAFGWYWSYNPCFSKTIRFIYSLNVSAQFQDWF